MRRTSSLLAGLAICLTLAACGKSGPKPSNADIAAYLAQNQPSYLRVGQVSAGSFEPARGLPDGSWRMQVKFVLRAEQDLFAPIAAARSQRAIFDLAVAKAEQFRLARIAAVEQMGRQAGLMPPGARAPEPAVPVHLATHKDQELSDNVTLLAQPDGHGWRFFQAGPQALDDTAIGAPMEFLRRDSPSVIFVTEGSKEDRDYWAREQKFMAVLARVPKL